MKPYHILLHVVEGKVYIVGVIGENTLEMVLDGVSDGRQLYLRRKLGLQFRGKVGHKTKFIVNLVVGLTVCKIFIHQGAARKGCCHHGQDPSDMTRSELHCFSFITSIQASYSLRAGP